MARLHPIRVLVAPLALFLAAACGGGGGGGGGGTPQPPKNLAYADGDPTYTACVAADPNVPSVTGTVTSWTVDPALPAGLEIDPATGAISGTPTVAAALAIYTVTASGPQGSTTADLAIEVVAPPLPSDLAYPGAQAVELVDVAVHLVPTYEGAPGSWSVAPALPAGLALDPVTGVITGAPEAEVALATYTITAEDCLGASTTVDLAFEVVATDALIAPRFVHVPAADGTIGVFGVRANGQLRAHGYDLVDAAPIDAATSWTQRHLLALTSGALASYAIDPLHGGLSDAPLASVALPPGSSPSRVFVDVEHRNAWVSLSGLGALAGFALAGDGTLAPLAGSPFDIAGVGPAGIALSSDAGLLYVANATSNDLTVLTLDASGVPIAENSAAVGGGPRDVAVLAGTGGDFVIVGEEAGDAIAVYAATGTSLTPADAATLSPGSSPLTLATAVVGGIGRLYVASDDASGHVQVFAVDTTTGALSAPTVASTGGPASDGAPLAFAIARDQTRAYTLFGATSELCGFTIDGSGLLAPVQPGSAPTNRARTRPSPRRFALTHGPTAFEYATDALYTANRAGGSVSQFAFDADADQLDALLVPEVAGPTIANGIAVHPRLPRLYVSDDPQATTSVEPVRIYALDADGSATAIGGHDAALSVGGFHALAIDPAGRYLAATARLQGELHLLAVQDEGSLADSAVAAVGTLPLDVAFAPHGAFVYCVTNADDRVHGFAVDPVGGTLTPVPGSPFGTSSAPTGLCVDSSGRFLYVACPGGDVISAFAIDPDDGSLDELAASPFATGLDPQDLVGDPTGRFVYVACSTAQAVFAHRVNLNPGNAFDDGTLTVPGSIAVAGPAQNVVFDPSGDHLFATLNAVPGAVVTFTMDSVSGTITPVDDDPTGAGSRSSAVRARPR